jgi:hypothetical protein
MKAKTKEIFIELKRFEIAGKILENKSGRVKLRHD